MIHSVASGAEPSLSSFVDASRAFGILDSNEWLDSVFAAHQEALAALPEQQKHFLLPKPRTYFESLLEGRGGAIIGAVDTKGELVGFCAVAQKDSWQEAQETRAVSCPDADQTMAALCSDKQIFVVQSFCVKPTSQGKAFSQGILEHAFLWAKKQVCASGKAAELVAQVSTDNQCGWTKFARAGYAMERTWAEGAHGVSRQKFLMRHLSRAELFGSVDKAVAWVDGASLNEEGPNALAKTLIGHVEQCRRAVLISPPSTQHLPFYAIVPVNG